MIQEYQIRVLPVVASSEQNIRQFVAEDKGIDVRTINAVRVLKRSIDARQRTIFINLTNCHRMMSMSAQNMVM